MLKDDPDIDVFSGVGCGIDSSKFNKLFVDAELFGKSFRRSDIDIVFKKHKFSARKLDFEGFQNALLEIAFKKGMRLGDLIDVMAPLGQEGPHNNHGTVAEANRFYDDRSTYTGAHKFGNSDDEDDGDVDLSSSAHGIGGGKVLQPEIDMTITASQLQDLEEIFVTFGSTSTVGKKVIEVIENSKFAKLCVDARLYDSNFAKESVDIIYTKHKSDTIKRRMEFEGFQNALMDIAIRKSVELGDLVDSMVAATLGGPSSSGTIAENNRFYDDQSTYTGAAAQGGVDTRQNKNVFGI